MKKVRRASQGRSACLVVFTLLFFVISAVPVIADPAAEAPETTLPPAPSTGDPSSVPSSNDVLEGFKEVEEKEEARELELESSEAVEERAASESLYADASALEAQALFQSEFAELIRALNSDPARFLSDATLEQPLAGGTAAQVINEGTSEILDAGIPVTAPNADGDLSKVDLSLVENEEGFEPLNPLTNVVLPQSAGEAIEVGTEGLSIRPAEADGESTAALFGDKNLFYHEVHTDTDLLASPTSRGVELSDLLRSAESPEALQFDLELPQGAVLRADGNGGAEIARDDKVLARMPFPYAIDAQGTDVPVELEVESSGVTLHVPHREANFAYPIYVDPYLVEDWYNCSWYNGCNLQALGDGSWIWNPQASWIYGSTSCIWSCWGSGRGLYISAESGWHGGGQFGQFSYTPPGSSSFITDTWIYPFFRNNYTNCPASKYPQPHDYAGLWTGAGWAPLNTNHANDYGSTYLGGGGRSVIIGLGNAGAAENKCRRDIVAGGASIVVTDPDVPGWNIGPSASDQWTDTAVVPISTGTATDSGLGVKYFNLYKSPSNGRTYDYIGNTVRECSGLHASPCGASWSSQIANYSPAALPNGVNWLVIFAYDALAIEHNSQGLPVHVNIDHSAPEVALTGDLFAAEPKTYKGEVIATDGSADNYATAQSGMKSVKIYFDGALVARAPDEASPPACNKVQQGINVASCKFEVQFELKRDISGTHTLKVVATDSLNHNTEKVVSLKLPKDEVPPTLAVTGPLKTASGLWLSGGATSATLDAKDAATGVVEEAIFIDGKQVGSSAKQECFSGGCSLNQLFNLSLDGYTHGPHTVKAMAKDGAGNKIEDTWVVNVDTSAPVLDPVKAPEVPEGWTPQISSFNLSYSASDVGSGVKKVEVSRPSTTGTLLKSTPFNSSCTGSASSPCPPTASGSTVISTTNMAQGVSNVTVQAFDAAGRVSSTRTVTVFVDRTAPAIISATGPLVSGSSVIGLATDLNLTARDTGSGIERMELLLDGEPIGVQTYDDIAESGGKQTCKGESCELKYAAQQVVGSGMEPGAHDFELVLKDWAGKSTSLAHEVVIDTTPPSVELSGALVDAAGKELENPVAPLEVEAEDDNDEFDSGVASVEVAVDGVPLQPRVDLVAVDKSNNRIQEFNDKGEFIRAFGTLGSADGQLNKPSGVTVDAKGNIWVADTGNKRIQKFTETGKFLLKCGSAGSGNGQFPSWGPKDLAVDAANNVWVSDYSGRIQQFSESCVYVKSIGGEKGTGEGQFRQTAGVDIGPGGSIWISDWENNRVSVFSSAGIFLRQFGTSGTGNGQFSRPDAVDVDSRGIVWVADQVNGRVQAFNEQGEYITQFGAKGTGEGQFTFNYPIGLVEDSKGALWVADASNNRVQKWTTPPFEGTETPGYENAFGAAGTSNGQFSHTADVALDAKGNLWTVDKNNNRIQEFNDKGEFIRGFGTLGSADGQMNKPSAVAVDSKGNVWVADTGNKRIQKFTETGQFLAKCGSAGSGNGQFPSWGPKDLAVDAANNVWVSDYSGRIQQFSESCVYVKAIGGAKGSGEGQFRQTAGVDIGPGGNIWISDWENNRVTVFNSAGVYIRQFVASAAGNTQFSRADAIDVDSRGVVWVVDQPNGRVLAFTEQGQYLTQLGEKGTGEGQFTFNYPVGLAADSRGALWIGDATNNRVQKWAIPNYRPSYASSFGGAGTSNGQFNHAADVALFPDECGSGSCAAQTSEVFSYNEVTWGSGPHTVEVTVTDGAGNFNVEELRVNEPLNVVAPTCPSDSLKVLSGGQVLGASAAISGIEGAMPNALEPSEPYGGEPEGEAEPVLEPSVTDSPVGVSLNEMGIDVNESLMGGGIEDEAAGAFTVGQAACLQPLQSGSAASEPTVVEDAAVVYPNAAPDTDTVIRPTASGTAIVEYLRGKAAPTEFSWAVGLGQDEELVKLKNGSIAVVSPEGEDVEQENVPPIPVVGPETLNDTDAQMAQAEHDLAVANKEVNGAVTMVIAAPEVVKTSGEVVQGILRITSFKVVTAELPPGIVAETEAMIIRTSPPAEPESICASVLARAPKYAPLVCGEEEIDSEEEDAGEPTGLWSLSNTSDSGLNSEISSAVTKFENQAYPSGASASSGSSGKVSGQQKRFCERGHEAECREFTIDGLQAAIAEDYLFNISSDGTQANAFRHSFWVALMRESEFNYQDGLAWSIAHEEDEWKSRKKSRRRGSRMDILNNFVGWRRAGSSERQSCEIMLKKAALTSIFLGAKRDPFAWAHTNDYQYFNPVYRKLRDNIGEDSTGLPVYATGTRCIDIGY